MVGEATDVVAEVTEVVDSCGAAVVVVEVTVVDSCGAAVVVAVVMEFPPGPVVKGRVGVT